MFPGGNFQWEAKLLRAFWLSFSISEHLFKVSWPGKSGCEVSVCVCLSVWREGKEDCRRRAHAALQSLFSLALAFLFPKPLAGNKQSLSYGCERSLPVEEDNRGTLLVTTKQCGILFYFSPRKQQGKALKES